MKNIRAYVSAVAGVLVIAFASAAVVGCERRTERPADELGAIYATLAQRPSALRLTRLPYLPPPVVRRAGVEPTNYALAAAANQVLAEPSRRSMHVTGVAHLLSGNYTAAVDALRRATERRPHDSDAWNDLAVAQYELATRTDDPRLLVSALASTDRALEGGAGAAAAFNRARVLDALGLRAPAAAAWAAFLALDGSSEWSTEARARLAAAEAPTAFAEWQKALPELERAVAARDHTTVARLVQTFPQYARTWGESDYLSRWGESRLAGDHARAARWLEVARAVGERLAAQNGEALLRDAVRAIDASADPPRLARAYVDYRTARKAIGQREPSRATALLESAEKRFAAEGSPMALVARYYRAGAVFDARDAAGARRLLDAIAPHPAYAALQAQVLWERARIEGRAGDQYEALALARRAAEMFDRLGEREFAAHNRLEAATLLAAFGQAADAWRILVRAFHEASESGRPIILEAVLHGAARNEIVDGRYDEARSLFHVMGTSPAYSPRLRFDALLWRTYLDTRAGRTGTDALTMLAAAATAVPDALRADAEDEFRFAEALLVRKSDPARATRLLDECIAFRRNAGRSTRLAEALVERGRVRGAAEDHDAALSLMEQQRERMDAADLRDSFFDAAGEACRELMSIHVNSGSAEAALETAERCRARALLDAAGAREPLGAREIQRALPTRTALLHYTTLHDRVAIIAITGTSLTMRTAPVSPLSYEVLIAPVADVVAATDKLIVVTDERIGSVAFAALRGSKYLIETHALTTTPSASAWVWRLRSPHRETSRDAFVAGDPALPPDSRLPRLASAAEEARRVAALYGTTPLLGNEATGARLRREARTAGVIHIASHAVVNVQDSRKSALLLAGNGGTVTVAEISALPLERSPLVVLAGCATGLRGGGRGSVTTLSAAFVAAGARGVVASLWDVDDETTLYFSTALHRRLSAGEAAAPALRAVQNAMLRSPDPRLRNPRSWGGFHLYGFD